MNVRLVIGSALALGIAACASTPEPNAALLNARTVVEAAQANPDVIKYAALDLDSARKQLALAEAASARHEPDAIAQPAYLAVQAGRLAQAHAAAKADDARVAAGQTERDQIQLAARTRDVASEKQATNAALGQRDQAADQAARLQAEMDQLKAKPTARGLVLTFGDVLFDTGRAELNSGSGRKLDQLAQFLTDHPERLVQIDGFTDSIGTDSYNQSLSQQRADAVKSALIGRGINSSRIGSQGYGKGFPVADNADAGGRQMNRRVEVVIGQDDGAAIAGRS
jgi:outer membrane protein OmpA-like peptidoglycan-associated protein